MELSSDLASFSTYSVPYTNIRIAPDSDKRNKVEQMRITKVSVYGLFERFNHDLVLTANEPITIMIGPNGFGKTMILRILNGLFNLPLKGLERLPFAQVCVLFDDSSSLIVERVSTRRSGSRSHDQPTLKLEYTTSMGNIERVNSEDAQVKEDDFAIPCRCNRRFDPSS